MIGPGKYDKLAEHCITEADAEAVVLIVVGGKWGPGMSAKVKLGPQYEIAIRNMDLLSKLPKMLRDLADSIEQDNKQGAPHA